MRIKDLLLYSIKNLWRRKLRTSLTIMGVIIGTTSIVLMMSLGIAMNQNFLEQLESMGSLTTIQVYPSYNMDSGMMTKEGAFEERTVKASDVESFKQLEHVQAASGIIELSLKMKSGKYLAWINLRGIDPDVLLAQNLDIVEGRMLEETDKMAFLFGSEVAYQFYDPTNSYGGGMYYGYNEERPPAPVNLMVDRIKASIDMSYGDKLPPGQQATKPVRPYNVTAVGLIGGQGEHSYSVYTTLDQARSIKKEQDRLNQGQNGQTGNKKPTEESYYQAIVQVDDMNHVQTVLDTIKSMGFEGYALMEYLESMQNQSRIIQMVLGGIGAVSLLVAAIGITNTMIMSIYERTKEIGIMKVIGARLKDIKKMFLIEAAMIGFVGGLVGLIVSGLGSILLNYIGGNMNLFGYGMGMSSKLSIIPMWLYGVSIAFTTGVGLVSGYLPAVRAMKLSVLGGLRTE